MNLRPVAVSAFFVLAGSHGGAAQSSQEIKALPPCAEKVAPRPRGWVETPVRARFSVSLPPDCRHEEGRRYVHGGDLWKCGPVSVEVVWGMWGSGSFAKSARECAADVGGLRVMVVREAAEQGSSLEVLYPIGEVHEPLVSAWSKRPEDLPVIEAVVFSGRAKPAR